MEGWTRSPTSREKESDDRVGGGVAPAVLPHHRTYGSVSGDLIVVLHTQVNSIETQLRGMQHVKLHSRVADLEEKVFGQARA